jgi:hypothetical protein
MSERDKKYIDPELERFFRENRDMIERLLKEERSCLKSVFEAERARAEEMAESQKNKAEDIAQGVIGMLMDPDVQRHFMAVGTELILGIGALMKAAPIPDSIREMAEEARKDKSDGFRKAGSEHGNESESASRRKVEIKSVPKKAPKPPEKSPAADKKTHD